MARYLSRPSCSLVALLVFSIALVLSSLKRSVEKDNFELPNPPINNDEEIKVPEITEATQPLQGAIDNVNDKQVKGLTQTPDDGSDNKVKELTQTIADLRNRLRDIEASQKERLERLEKEYHKHLTKFHADSAPPTTSPSKVLDSKATQGNSPRMLTRMGLRGEEFMKSWRPFEFNFTDEERSKIWNGFGSDNLNVQNCTVPDRTPVVTRFAYHGLGMNLLQLCNYIIYASYNRNYVLTMVNTYEYDRDHSSILRHPFQNWFEQHFSLFSKDTTCDIFGTVCAQTKDRCYDGIWDNPSGNPKMNLWKAATGFMSTFRHSFTSLHDASKILLMREILRLKPRARAELDKRHKAAVEEALGKHDPSKVTRIAVHIRRTDKITGEATAVPSEIFVKGLKRIIALRHLGDRVIILHLITDDNQVLDEFKTALKMEPELESKLNIAFRGSPGRPDRVRNEAELDHFFWYLLVDFRLMIESDMFLGSQSS